MADKKITALLVKADGVAADKALIYDSVAATDKALLLDSFPISSAVLTALNNRVITQTGAITAQSGSLALTGTAQFGDVTITSDGKIKLTSVTKIDLAVAAGNLVTSTGITSVAGTGVGALSNAGVTLAVTDAPKLTTAQPINNVNFDGSTGITVREVSVSVLPADQTYVPDSPPLAALNAEGTSIAAWDLCYISTTPGIKRCVGTNTGSMFGYAGMAISAAATNTYVTILKAGLVHNTGWTWTPGAPLFISDATSGLVTTTPPTTTGNMVKIVGNAVTSTTIQLTPGHPVVVVA